LPEHAAAAVRRGRPISLIEEKQPDYTARTFRPAA
jgi:hypothetical protein